MAWGWVLLSVSAASWSSYALMEVPLLYVAALWFGTLAASYWLLEVRPATLTVGDGPWKDFLCTQVPAVTANAMPTPWLLEPRLHTVVAAYLPDYFQPPLTFRREVVNLTDGGQVALDWVDADETLQDHKKPRIIAFLIGGLTSDSSAAYLRAPVRDAQRRGITCVVFNNRGMGGLPLKNELFCTNRHWPDIKESIVHIRKSRPDDIMIGLGFSNGGLLMTQMASSDSENISAGVTPFVDVLLAMSMPWDVKILTKSLARGINIIFSKVMTEGFKQLLRNNEEVLQSLPHYSAALKAETLYEFDAAFTAPHISYTVPDVGVMSEETFYKLAIVRDKVHLIKTPLLAINAEDDPFLMMEAVPTEDAGKSQHVAIMVPARGGHIGFLEGLFGQSSLVTRVWNDFLDASIKEPSLLRTFATRTSETRQPARTTYNYLYTKK